MTNAVANLRKLADFCEKHNLAPLNFDVGVPQVHISNTDWPRLATGQRVAVERGATWDYHTTTVDGVQVLALLKAKPQRPEIEVIEDYQPA